MVVKDTNIIKRIICSNFDKSAALYESFEQKYGLFGHLSNELAKACNIQKGMTVCDIGCGTGASTVTLGEIVGKEGRVMGIDFSEEMLRSAKDKSRQFPNIELKLCDAEVLDEIGYKIDAALYNASIFLIPNLKQTLQASYEKLECGGIVGMNYLEGVFDEVGGVNLFMSAKEEGLESAPYGREVADVDLLPGILKEVGFRGIQGGVTPIKMTGDEIMDFYSIPAQSAGLYPKTPYEERLKLLDALLDHIGESTQELYQIWGWRTGTK